MKLKKLGYVLLVSSMFLISSCGGAAQTNTGKVGSSGAIIKVGFLTDTAGLGDQGFNDAVNVGVTGAAKENTNIKISTVTPTDAGSIESTLRSLAQDGNQLIIVGSATEQDATKVVSKEFPNTKFVQIDGNVADLKNVMSLTFKEQEAAYLTGAFCGLMSDDKVGFVGGMNIPVVQRFEAGFTAGAKAVGKTDDQILITYTGTFTDPALGKETAGTLCKNGAKYIFPCAGACNLGVFEAASDGSFIPLGAATGQFDKSDKIIASHIKSVDTLSKNIILAYAKDGTFTSGITVNGLKEGGVDFRYNPKNASLNVKIPQKVTDKINQLKADIISGKIVVPDKPEKKSK